MQLVAYGAQDIYLTGNPQITFFKVVYRRHTNFSMEAIKQTYSGSARPGNKITTTISRNGDLLTNMWIEADIKDTDTTNINHSLNVKIGEKLTTTTIVDDLDDIPTNSDISKLKQGSMYEINLESNAFSSNANLKELQIKLLYILFDNIIDIEQNDDTIQINYTISGSTFISRVRNFSENIPGIIYNNNTGNQNDDTYSGTPDNYQSFYRNQLNEGSNDSIPDINLKNITLNIKANNDDSPMLNSKLYGIGRNPIFIQEDTFHTFLRNNIHYNDSVGDPAFISINNLFHFYELLTSNMSGTISATNKWYQFLPAMTIQEITTEETNNTFEREEGLTILKNIDLEIGGQLIDSHPYRFIHGYQRCFSSSDELQQLATLSTCSGGNKSNIILPMHFWFCKDPGLALPLIALQYHEVKIIISFNNYLHHKLSHNTTTYKIDDLFIWGNYIYLDTDERRRFAQVSHEYLIEQVQTQEFSLRVDYTEEIMTKIDLNFNHPVKYLLWYMGYSSSNFDKKIRNIKETDIYLTKAQLKLNGHDRFDEQKGDYFANYQFYQSNIGNKIQNNIKIHDGVQQSLHQLEGLNSKTGNECGSIYYLYSFGLNPKEHQPSGTCNFSRIDNAEFIIKHKSNNKIIENFRNAFAHGGNTGKDVEGLNTILFHNKCRNFTRQPGTDDLLHLGTRIIQTGNLEDSFYSPALATARDTFTDISARNLGLSTSHYDNNLKRGSSLGTHPYSFKNGSSGYGNQQPTDGGGNAVGTFNQQYVSPLVSNFDSTKNNYIDLNKVSMNNLTNYQTNYLGPDFYSLTDINSLIVTSDEYITQNYIGFMGSNKNSEISFKDDREFFTRNQMNDIFKNVKEIGFNFLPGNDTNGGEALDLVEESVVVQLIEKPLLFSVNPISAVSNVDGLNVAEADNTTYDRFKHGAKVMAYKRNSGEIIDVSKLNYHIVYANGDITSEGTSLLPGMPLIGDSGDQVVTGNSTSNHIITAADYYRTITPTSQENIDSIEKMIVIKDTVTGTNITIHDVLDLTDISELHISNIWCSYLWKCDGSLFSETYGSVGRSTNLTLDDNTLTLDDYFSRSESAQLFDNNNDPTDPIPVRIENSSNINPNKYYFNYRFTPDRFTPRIGLWTEAIAIPARLQRHEVDDHPYPYDSSKNNILSDFSNIDQIRVVQKDNSSEHFDNFSIRNIELILDDNSVSHTLHMNAVNYNVLRIMGGMGGLAYSN